MSGVVDPADDFRVGRREGRSARKAEKRAANPDRPQQSVFHRIVPRRIDRFSIGRAA
jgi:hypothetical protein